MESIFSYRGGNKQKEPAPCDEATLCRPSSGILLDTHSTKCSSGAVGLLKLTAAPLHAEKRLAIQSNTL